ncbi:hypothetical protein [Dubosiella newyorkensis]|uniref:Uncharacterized protein n=1 Tax=Dubosiella newyorkensis TaxID=1862672 RepID=A0A1U7NQU2_9FIRM|nr:hypothetical protein [Dubosiella newyorkensis]OLU47998.1 hypothetical protein BO225_00225 [Dubosiella newyorkensis]
MKRLSKKSEKLLKEILDHRLENRLCDIDYWEKRFRSLSIGDDRIIRSQFKELMDAEMISVSWADNYPYIMVVLSNDNSYFEEKNQIEESLSSNICVNNFSGPVNTVQIQQGTYRSTQNQSQSVQIDELKLYELIDTIKTYDSVLETELGKEYAENLRSIVAELERIKSIPNEDHKKFKLVTNIKDILVNVLGGVGAEGFIRLINEIFK